MTHLMDDPSIALRAGEFGLISVQKCESGFFFSSKILVCIVVCTCMDCLESWPCFLEFKSLGTDATFWVFPMHSLVECRGVLKLLLIW